MTKLKMLFALSLLAAAWFALTSWMWGYYANVFFSFPFALLSAVLFHFGRKSDDKKEKYKVILIVLGIGITSALVTFFIFLL